MATKVLTNTLPLSLYSLSRALSLTLDNSISQRDYSIRSDGS